MNSNFRRVNSRWCVLAGLSLWFGTACSSSVEAPNYTCESVNPMPQCCATPAPANCPGSAPGGNMMMNQVAGTAAVMSQLSQTKDNIQKLEGGASGVKKNGSDIQNAALAKIVAPAPGTLTPVDRSAPSPLDLQNTLPGGSASGAATTRGAAAGKSSAGSGLQALSPAGQNGAGSGSAATAGMDDARSGAYASGGGGGRGGKGSSWSFGGELGGGGAADGKTGQANFKGAGDEINPVGSEDPEDYFARLSMEDSLFKIIERRYVRKQESWVRADQSLAVSRAKQH